MKGSLERDIRRMELHGVIRVASEVIPQYWPMRAFVHHNPLHHLERLPFDDAVRLGGKLLGGHGYLSGDAYRDLLRSGRIREDHLAEAVQPVARDEAVDVGPRRIRHHEVLLACMTHGLCRPRGPHAAAFGPPDCEDVGADVRILARRLAGTVALPAVDVHVAAVSDRDRQELARFLTLADWCDRTVGTTIVPDVNFELVKWCAAFLDEGHATWEMPGRSRGFYQAWKSLVARQWTPGGIRGGHRKIVSLPEQPEDAVLESLDLLGIPDGLRQDYLSLLLAALPGWAGFLKWRSEQRDYAWQQAYPASLVDFLAMSLWYRRERVMQACRESLGIAGNYDAIAAFMAERPREYYLRKELVAGRLPPAFAREAERLARRKGSGWEALAERLHGEVAPHVADLRQLERARRLAGLAQALGIPMVAMQDAAPGAIETLIRWMDAFPETEQGPIWLRALEAGFQERLLGALARRLVPGSVLPPSSPSSSHLAAPAPLKESPESAPGASSQPPQPSACVDGKSRRPASQAIFCIDVRSEPLRRHLEAIGPHETYGFPGFFAALIRYRAWGKDHYTEQVPAVMRARHEVREVPRSYFETPGPSRRSRANLLSVGHTLLRDLKENVVTPYVMVESVGWLYGIPLVGKTLCPSWYGRLASWARRLATPRIPTALTVDKLTPTDVEDLVAAEHRAVIRKVVRDHVGLRGLLFPSDFTEALRHQLLDEDGGLHPDLGDKAAELGIPGKTLQAILATLRRDHHIDRRSAAIKKDRLTRTGLTVEEQVVTVETMLRMIGLTSGFARLVLLCAHGSTSENNPYESALDCGACGGNEGKPNARVVARMANNPVVREGLARIGIPIPADTHFLAGQVDTTTDEIRLFDLEGVPLSHDQDVARLQADLRAAAALTARERYERLPDRAPRATLESAVAHVRVRSADWSQVRPEWGLSGSAAFIIGTRALTRGLDLAGRVFLHSYDHRQDPAGRSLEVIMTGPQLVAHWIVMEHYFSTVDNDVHGSGSKIYHNVVGRLGIMSGPWSDLRPGLARQTVMNGDRPYHEPMRLLTVIEAPPARIDRLIERHELLQRYYGNGWVNLAAHDPDTGQLYRYRPTGGWELVFRDGKESV